LKFSVVGAGINYLNELDTIIFTNGRHFSVFINNSIVPTIKAIYHLDENGSKQAT
jgi:hypothetical protein